jgi:DNA helicase HerA-like ATPase
MAHTIILGITETGKTTLARKIAGRYKAQGIPVLVLDPYGSRKWNANYLSEYPKTFCQVVRNSRSCALFVDECGHWVDQGFEADLKWLATNSRHFGHNCHFISQRATQISPTIRAQCSNIFLFRQSFTDTRDLARDFASDDLMQAHTLLKGEYLGKVDVDGKVYKARIF